MRTPIFNLVALTLPTIVGTYGYYWARTTLGATNMGEAMAPFFVLAMFLTIAAAAGEGAAVVSLVRGERLAWLSWLAVAVNGALLLPALYLLTTMDWR